MNATHEYYFSVADLAVYENGNSCEAYVKMTLDCEVDEQLAVALMGKQFPSFKGKFRVMSHEEYIELAGDEENENA